MAALPFSSGTIISSATPNVTGVSMATGVMATNTAVLTNTQSPSLQAGSMVSGIKQEPSMKMNSSPLPSVSPTVSISTPPRPITATVSGLGEKQVLDKRRLQELVKEVDPLEQLDDDVEEVLMQIADDFIDNVASAACQLAKHRKANTVEVKDVQLHLERNWNMLVPGFGAEELRPYKKAATTEAHKQRLALIKKTLKKY